MVSAQHAIAIYILVFLTHVHAISMSTVYGYLVITYYMLNKGWKLLPGSRFSFNKEFYTKCAALNKFLHSE